MKAIEDVLSFYMLRFIFMHCHAMCIFNLETYSVYLWVFLSVSAIGWAWPLWASWRSSIGWQDCLSHYVVVRSSPATQCDWSNKWMVGVRSHTLCCSKLDTSSRPRVSFPLRKVCLCLCVKLLKVGEVYSQLDRSLPTHSHVSCRHGSIA